MTPYPAYTDQPGLQAALAAANIAFWWQNGVAQVSDLAAAQAIVAAYNPLPALQAAAITQVTAQLESLITVGYTYQGVLISIDAASTNKIDAMCTRALANLQGTALGVTVQPFPVISWPAQNGGPALSIATPQVMVEFGDAIGHYVCAIEQYANVLATQIAEAATVTALQAINLTTGWPSS